MNRAMFSGVAGLKAHQTKMDVIGNNIANVNTYGFKAQHAIFSDVFYQTLRGASAGSAGTAATDTTPATGATGGIDPSSVGYGSKLVAVRSDMSSSSLQSTGNSLDVAITGEGFITVRQGSGGSTFYTKAGELGVDTAGNLVDVNGDLVCGLNYTKGTDNLAETVDAKGNVTWRTAPANGYKVSPLNLLTGLSDAFAAYSKANSGTEETLPSTASMSDLTGISIGADGTVSATYKDKSYQVGKIMLANFQNPAGLQAAGSGYFVSSANSGTAKYSVPGTDGTGSLQSSTLEMSNVDLASEFADMITTQRGFQANSRIISVSDSMLEELINLKR